MQKYDEINFKTNPNPTSSFYGDGFSQYETLLALIQRINDMIDSNNLNVDEIEDLKQKKLDIETYLNDIKNNRKLDENGDFKGTWFGLEMHETDEGLATDWNNAKGTFDTVTDRMNDVDENISEHETLLVSHSASLADIAVQYMGSPSGIDDTSTFQNKLNLLKVNGGGRLIFGCGTYKLNNITLKGLNNIIFRGQGQKTILDFSIASGGIGLEISYDNIVGSCQNIIFENLNFSDTRTTSLLNNLILVKSGLTEQTPAQTVANINFYNCDIGKYNNNDGVAFIIDGVSGMTFKKVNWGFHLGCGTGLLITNTNDINTGVIDFVGCSINAKKTALKIHSQAQLIDSISFYDTGLFNWESGIAEETLIIGGSQTANINFHGIHIENRHKDMTQAVLLTGNILSCNFDGIHVSCGNATNQNLYAFKLESGNKFGITFNSIEVFKTKTRTNGGRHIYVANNVVTSQISPIVVINSTDNSSTTQILEVQNNDENILKNIVSPTNLYSCSGKDYVYTITDGTDNPNIVGVTKAIIDVATTFTRFTGHKGQIITLTAKQQFTITSNYTYIRLNDGKDVVIEPEETITLMHRGDVWVEVSRTVNTINGGTFTLTPNASLTVNNNSCRPSSIIVFSPLSKSASQLSISSKSLYLKSLTNGSFVVETCDLGIPIGNETFSYIVYNE